MATLSRFFIAFALFVTLSVNTIASAENASPSSARELIILNWSDYLDPELIEEFEQEFNVNIKEVYFENDEARDRLMLQSDGQGYDIAIVDGTTLTSYQQRGWLASIDERDVPNLQHIDKRWLAAHPSANGHAVPYFWGTIGIAYRSDLVSDEITSWQQILSPAEELRGRIVMVDDNRDLLSPALITLGGSPNSSDPQDLEAASVLLQEQRPYVREYGYVSLGEESELVTGDVWVAMMYSGDALVVQEHNESIEYVVPEEGTVLWVDYLAVLNASSKKALAKQFINFLNEPGNAARQAEYVYYPTPNKAAEALLPAEFLEDELIYPPQERIEKSEFYRVLPAPITRRYANITAAVTD